MSTTTSTQFLWEDLICILQIENGFLCLKSSGTYKSNTEPLSTLDKYIDFVNIISTNFEEDKWKVDENGEPLLETIGYFSFKRPKLSSCFTLHIHFWVRSDKRCRKLETIKLRTKKKEHCMEMHSLIQQELKRELNKQGYVRPHNLLVIVNPKSGKRKAKSVHEKVVSPLFKLAGIKETVILTEYQNHAKKYVETADLSSYDGVIAIGGDGTFSEVLNGVLIAKQREKGIALCGDGVLLDKPMPYSKPSIKLGLIPGGTNNSFNSSTQGTTDPVTATLQIISGENHPLGLSSLHDKRGNLLTFSSLTACYGFGVDAHKACEKIHFLGPSRVFLGLLYAIANFKHYPCEVTYLPACDNHPVDISKDTTRCRYPCHTCLEETNLTKELKRSKHDSVVLDENKYLKVIHDNFLAVNLTNGPCIYNACPRGASPSAHLSDGNIDLVLMKNASRGQLLNVFRSYVSRTKNYLDQPFFETARVKGIRIRSLSDEEVEPMSVQKKSKDFNGSAHSQPVTNHRDNNPGTFFNHKDWFVDGELITGHDEITVWGHKGLINVFAKGIEEYQILESCV